MLGVVVGEEVVPNLNEFGGGLKPGSGDVIACCSGVACLSREALESDEIAYGVSKVALPPPTLMKPGDF
jgi:hypothetical protein